MKRAVITGITGQDGAYLAAYLLNKNYSVTGTFRRTSSENFWRIEELGIKAHPNLNLVELDLTDLSNCIHLIQSAEPDEIYNLAAQSFVGVSFAQPIATAEITGLGVTNMLEAIRTVNQKIRFYQASTSEMFGKVQQIPQTEETPFYPRSPYGVAKLYGHWITINYRESYDMFATSGILFNHESPLRGLEFVTRKITDGVARIKQKKLDCLELGNLDVERDWGFAGDYVRGMYLMLQAETPDTFVLATNKAVRLREFVELAFSAVDIEIEWRGAELSETAVDTTTGRKVVSVNPKYYRPAEVDCLLGNPEKAREVLGWEASKSLEELCGDMVREDMRRVKSGVSF